MTAFEEKYRRKAPGLETAPAVAAPSRDASAKDTYQAFNALPQAQFDLWVRTSSSNQDTDTALPYSRRNHMITDGSGFVISLHYDTPVICVTIQGRNLQELFRGLLKHEVEWLMEFDPRKCAEPPQDAPCILDIKISRKPLPESKDDAMPGQEPSGRPATH